MDSLLENVWLRRRLLLDTDCLAVMSKSRKKDHQFYYNASFSIGVHHQGLLTCLYLKTGSQLATFS